MTPTAAVLDWVAGQRDAMVARVTEWALVNTGSHNVAGLGTLHDRLMAAVGPLGGEVTELPLPPDRVVTGDGSIVDRPLGRVLSIRKRPEAARRVLLVIHTDTVFGSEHPFQAVTRTDANTLNGPGVADAKGGLAVLLTALEAFEQSDLASRLGWEVLLNPDEELGSPGSGPLLAEAARRNHLGLVYEPAHPDGTLVGERKGSGTFSVTVKGRAAHAGRDFHHGRNAVQMAAEVAVAVAERSGSVPGLTVNVGRIEGGGPTNVVPDRAAVHFNVRLPPHDPAERALADLQRTVAAVADRRDGFVVEMIGSFTSPPRPMDVATTRLYQQLATAGQAVGLNLSWHASGGVSDANKLSAAGLPTIDTLGPCGGNLHSDGEFIQLDTLVSRAQLSAAFLMSVAAGEVEL
jgi:glutamate carboxypeptidase